MFSAWRWKLFFLAVESDATPSALLLGKAQCRRHATFSTPHSYFSDNQHLNVLQRWCWKTTFVVLYVAPECEALHLCLNMSAVCVCLSRPAPSHSRKYQYKLLFFFSLCVSWSPSEDGDSTAGLLYRTWQVFCISNMFGLFPLRLPTTVPQACKCCVQGPAQRN